jgi:hypothetical protein
MPQPSHSAPQGPGGPGLGGATATREEVREQLDAGGHDRFAHYVRKEKILASAVSGSPVVALCGKVWVPGRDPSRYPVCPACKEIYQQLRPGEDSQDN